MANIFDDPKSIKTWAIKLANACGGQKVEKSIVLTSLNTKRLAELLDQFVQDHNENTMKIAQEIDLSNDEQQLADKEKESNESSVVFHGKEVKMEEE